MESYVVRIYRRYEAEPGRVIGLVEHPERGTIERFNGVAELLKILLAPTQSAEIVATPEERDRAGAGR
ncbi:MAG TPA: hypothetical protein VEI74_15240 [Candidatus Methylomirabilis sp.]|nr:hypothetical protein [Candidatus Methylomirabilis sp.]